MGAATVSAILATGEAVYGINTGFGKLASVRIAADDLATLQRNIVLSHAAGTGASPTASDKVKVLDYSGGIPGDRGQRKFWEDGVHPSCYGSMKMIEKAFE